MGQWKGVGPAFGDCAPLVDGDELLGTVVRTRPGAGPLFVSPGHLIGFDEALRWTLAYCRGYRMPELTRLADRISKGRA